MTNKTIFSGPVIKSELVLMILEKWGLHPEMKEAGDTPDTDDLGRDSLVVVPDAEYDRAHEILFGESEVERAGF